MNSGGCRYIVRRTSCTGSSLAKKEMFHIEEVGVPAGCWTRFNKIFLKLFWGSDEFQPAVSENVKQEQVKPDSPSLK